MKDLNTSEFGKDSITKIRNTKVVSYNNNIYPFFKTQGATWNYNKKSQIKFDEKASKPCSFEREAFLLPQKQFNKGKPITQI